MDNKNNGLANYIENADSAVQKSIQNIHDIDIDGYSDEGCNGYVLFGEHKIFRTRVAVKYYYYGETSHEEVSLIKQVSHKNILKVWDAHTIPDGWAYFVTDELHNGNMDELLARPINTHLAISIARGVLSGVGALHAEPHSLIHRDLKPANILLDQKMQPIIADFGSIKRMPKGACCVPASQHSALYRPPESYNDGLYYFSSDIYQVGLVLYQLLGGYLPYDIMHYMTAAQKKTHSSISSRCEQSKYEDSVLFEKAKRGHLVDFLSLPAYTDKRFTKMIKKAINPDPQVRFQNVADFLLDFHHLGSVPDWYQIDDNISCVFEDASYRITKQGNQKFVIEKCNYAGTWSKLRSSSVYSSVNEAITALLERLGTR